MRSLVEKFKSKVTAILPAGLIVATALGPVTETLAANVATNIPIMVVAEDADPTSVKRSSDIFKRVIPELASSMGRRGFQIIDEESVSADLGWKMVDRREKLELISTIKAMNKSDVASHRFRAWVLLRVHASAKEVRGRSDVKTRIVGEVYDALSNKYLDTFEMPIASYPGPADCVSNPVCINEIVGTKARELALSLGDILAKKLERFSPVNQTVDTPNESGVVVGDAPSRKNGHGMLINYTVKLSHFKSNEALTVVGVMADEFPGYHSHNLMNKASMLRRYAYQTTAKAYKMEEWLHILLADMGYDVENEIELSIAGDNILIDKLVPTPSRPVSEDEMKRFH